jgi:hypothetical protein
VLILSYLPNSPQPPLITGEVVASVLVITDHPTAGKTSAIKAFDSHRPAAHIEISFRVADPSSQSSAVRKIPRSFGNGVKQAGLHPVLTRSLQMIRVFRLLGGVVHTHHDAMAALRTDLASAGMPIGDQAYSEHFTRSLPTSIDPFITLYDNTTSTWIYFVASLPSTR